jgi:hypothetical protein
VIPQFHHVLKNNSDSYAEREGQQQVLRATFPGIRDGVRELVGRKMEALARAFARTQDVQVKDEIERLAREYRKLKKPWVFVAAENFTTYEKDPSYRFPQWDDCNNPARVWLSEHRMQGHRTANSPHRMILHDRCISSSSWRV